MNLQVKVRRKPDRKYLQLYYVDPSTGNERTRSAKTHRWREAERAAAAWDRELAEDGHSGGKLSLEHFETLYCEAMVATRGECPQLVLSAFGDFLRTFGNIADIRAIDEMILVKWQGAMAGRGHRPQTCSTYMTRFRTALRWGKDMRLLPRVPAAPRNGHCAREPRGRPLTTRECWQLLRATRAVRPWAWRAYTRALHLMWLTGLRQQEALRLSWDSGPVRVRMGERPHIEFRTSGQKGRRAECVPVTPACAAWLRRTPSEERIGRVCDAPIAGFATTMYRVSKAAGVVVNEETGALAGCHDLRRTFGTRWSYRVQPLTLQKLMRHKDIKTTLKYYVHQDLEKITEEVWNASKD